MIGINNNLNVSLFNLCHLICNHCPAIRDPDSCVFNFRKDKIGTINLLITEIDAR